MEKHVLYDWFARLDAIWILARLGRKKSNGNAARCTVSRPNRTNAAVCFMDTAASTGTGRRACCTSTNGHAGNAKRTGDFYA